MFTDKSFIIKHSKKNYFIIRIFQFDFMVTWLKTVVPALNITINILVDIG